MSFLLPPNFEWLNEVEVKHGPLPKMIANALQYLGVTEIKGSGNNPVIMDMAKGLGIDDIFTSDDKQAWCAVFANHIIRISNKPIDLHPKDRYDLLRALKTANLFQDVAIKEWKLGDIMLLKREGGGHVFFPIAETNSNGIIGLGGNQGNAVKFSEFDINRAVGCKRSYGTAMPESAQQYKMSSTGTLSVNEV